MQSQNDESKSRHANHHVPKFLHCLHDSSSSSSNDLVQILTDGTKLTAKNLMNGKLNPSLPILVLDSPTSIGMTLPTTTKTTCRKKNRVTVRDVANVIGHAHPVSVIDVQHQEELEGWTLGDLVDYFEDEERLQKATASTESVHVPSTTRRRRAAASQAMQKQQEQLQPMVLNQISLEFSRTPLHAMVKSPQFVRDLDWIDHAWPQEKRSQGDYPVVQYYCLTSTAGCYTDFHVDFGGTSVWYHVLCGEKKFVLIRPTRENLVVYEDWLCRSNQAALFLPDLVETKEDILTVSLKEGQTLVIPTGWIHAVYTPVDSLVFGGNFLHSLDISLQLEIHYLETRARVPNRFRFPHFLPLQFYAGGMFLSKLQSNAFLSQRELEGLEDLITALEGWWKLKADETFVIAANDAARQNGCESVEEMLTLLKMERTKRLLKKDAAPSPERPRLRLKLAPAESKPNVALSLPPDTGKFGSESVCFQQSPPWNAKPAENSIGLKLSPPRETKASADIGTEMGDSSPNTERRLNLSSSPRDSPKPCGKIRLKMSSKSADPSTSSNFRIVLPATARPAVAKPKRKSLQREGLDEFIPANVDDDWEPEVQKKKKSKGGSFSNSRPQAKVGAARSKSNKPTSSRQRLMSRFR